MKNHHTMNNINKSYFKYGIFNFELLKLIMNFGNRLFHLIRINNDMSIEEIVMDKYPWHKF